MQDKTENHVNTNKVLASLNNFEIRADGLACPYCAYGIEKKFKAIKGVKHIDVDLKKGLVKISSEKTVKFSEQQLKTLFSDSGFTYRSIKQVNTNLDESSLDKSNTDEKQ
ncbi:MAG: hypothetical protein COB35_01305 [Gammaproteobacteria bacterium]|nr:MAG: hypothetical protein COB35_01305 [Gammaproteobacteria bacterium]